MVCSAYVELILSPGIVKQLIYRQSVLCQQLRAQAFEATLLALEYALEHLLGTVSIPFVEGL
jgi:hypothetical protein